MLNFYLQEWGQAHRLTPTFIIEPFQIGGKSVIEVGNICKRYGSRKILDGREVELP